jgi:hypothetical protein
VILERFRHRSSASPGSDGTNKEIVGKVLDNTNRRKGGSMKETRLTMPELSLIAGTRAALGGGVALLLADRLTRNQRKAVGLTLLLVGAITTIPLGILVLCRRR